MISFINARLLLLFFLLLQGQKLMSLHLTSPSFKENERIPSKYTCEGEDISPALVWESAPEGTKSFALIVDDPDAPGWTRIHWVVYNIPPTVFSCKEGEAPMGSIQGANDKGDLKYRGPCPPPLAEKHRYFFKLYALKEMLNLPKGATKQEVEDSMESLILEKTQMIGTYSR
jgi:Raf kinase inhibitor-like YbhB/YbcL family protein